MKKMILIFLAVAFFACEKEKNLTGTIYYKGQLQCSGDNWSRGANDDQTIQNMINHLATKGINVVKAEITPAPTDRVFCEACICPSGRTYVITVSAGSEEELNKEGFFK